MCLHSEVGSPRITFQLQNVVTEELLKRTHLPPDLYLVLCLPVLAGNISPHERVGSTLVPRPCSTFRCLQSVV